MYEIKTTGEDYPKKTQVFSKQEEQLAFVNALKAVDYEKEYQQALRDIAETVLDMRFDKNNRPIVEPNEESGNEE